MQSSRTLSADWTQVLARVEAALAKAVARIEEREHALAAAPLPQTAKPPDFARFEQRLAGFATCPQPAEKHHAQLDADLRDGEDALRQWLARAEVSRKQLATWVGRAIG